MFINTLPPLTRNVTCAVTGHRVMRRDFNPSELEKELSDIADDGYEYFLIGMARGFDTECFHALEALREKGKNVKIVAVVPCKDQSARFPAAAKEEYARMLGVADEVIAEPSDYFDGCMLRRNDFLVENCSLLLANYNGIKKGGTYYTVRQAIALGVTVREFGRNL